MTGARAAKVGAVTSDVRVRRTRDLSAGTVVLDRGELESVAERAHLAVHGREASFGGRSGTPIVVSARPWWRPVPRQ